MDKLVSVIMLNWNTPEMTLECVQSVNASDYDNFVVNVIDNGSGNANYEILKKEAEGLTNLFRIEKNRGYAGGMNYALEVASAQQPAYFLIMNNDTILHRKAISELVSASKRYNDRCVVTGKVYHYDDPQRLQTVGSKFDAKTLSGRKIGAGEIDRGQYDQESQREMIDDIFMLLPYAIYQKVGGYSDYFYLNYEQADLVIRIKEAGFKVIYTPGAMLYHKGSFSSGGLGNPYMMYWDGKSSLVFHYLHLPRITFMFYAAKSFLQGIYSVLKGVLAFMLLRTSKTNLRARYARWSGVVAGIRWTFNPQPETGYNPFEANK